VKRRTFLRQLLFGSSLTTASLSGCGTLLHKERINAPQSRDLDWKIVALNGLGLALFFIPGVIAFVVDFYTGAIYLPPKRTAYKPIDRELAPETNANSAHLNSNARWQKLDVPPAELNLRRIETVLAERCRHPVSLESAQTRVSRLQDLADYPRQVERHRREKSFGQSLRAFFRV